jgi:hypothetical protein
LHQIATSLCWAKPFGGGFSLFPPLPVALFVAYLDEYGNPFVFQQVPDGGVWSGPYQLPTPQYVSFTSLVGVNNYLLGLGYDGNVYVAVFNQAGSTPQASDWSAFTVLPAPPGGASEQVEILDFSAVEIIDFSAGSLPLALIIVAVVDHAYVPPEYAGGGYQDLEVFALNLSRSVDDLNVAIQDSVGWENVGGFFSEGGGLQSPVLAVKYEGSTPTIVLVVIDIGFSNYLRSWRTADGLVGLQWEQSNLANMNEAGAWGVNAPASLVLTSGNPDSTFELIVVFGTWTNPITQPPAVFSSNDGLAWVSPLPVIPFSEIGYIAAAAGSGNSGNLQVIILGTSLIDDSFVTLPYLMWQNSNGNWTYGSVLQPNGWPPIQTLADVAAGMGWSDQGPSLQVAYFGRGIYVNWQDPNGNWHWYPGLQGQGLP